MNTIFFSPSPFSCDLIQALKSDVLSYSERMRIRNAQSKKQRLTQRKKDRLDVLLINFVCVNTLPFKLIESQHFRSFLRELLPDYKPPTRQRLAGSLLHQRAEQCRIKIRDELRKVPDYSLSVEFDGWTTPTGEKWIAICLTQSDGHADLIELVDLTMFRIDASLYAKKVYDAVQCLRIPLKKLNAVVSDNESASKNARTRLINGRPSGPGSRITHLIDCRCMAHFVNLIIESIAKSPELRGTLSELNDLIKIINRCKPLAGILKSMGARKPVNIVPTRWYSVCNAIKSILAIKDALHRVPKEDRYNYENWKPYSSDDTDFWDNLEGSAGIFSKLSKLVGIAESRYANIATIFEGLLRLARELSDDSIRIPGIEHRFRIAALRSFINYFHKLDLDLMFAAYMLDPNYKLKYLTPEAIIRGQIRIVQYCIDMDRDDVQAKLCKHEIEIYKQTVKGITDYVPDVRIWWSQSKFTFLKEIALRLLTLVPNSANTERVFSALKQIMSPRRNRLDICSVYDLMTVKIHSSSRSSDRTESAESPPESQNVLSSMDSDDMDVEEDIDQSLSVDDIESGLIEQEVDDQDDESELERGLECILFEEDPIDYLYDDSSQETQDVPEGEDLFTSEGYSVFRHLINFEYSYLDSIQSSQCTSSPASSAERARAMYQTQ